MAKSLSDLILERKSVKKYYKKNVSTELVAEVLDAGRWAPSAGNLQDWRFIVIRSEKTKEAISLACLDQDWMLEAPVFIAVCSDFSSLKEIYKKMYRLFSIQNCALATENMLLKATDLGLGTCVVAPFDSEKIKEILGVPENLEVYSIITLGYPREIEPSMRHNLRDVTFFEKWGEFELDNQKKLKDVEMEVEAKLRKVKAKMNVKLPLQRLKDKFSKK